MFKQVYQLLALIKLV